MGFYFLISTASMFPDITFLMNPLLGEGEQSQTATDSIKSAKAPGRERRPRIQKHDYNN